MRNRFFLSFISVSILAFANFSHAIEQDAKEFVLCKNQKEVRALSVTMNADTCIAHYSKSGSEEVVAQGKSPDTCHQRIEQIQNVLKAASYNCKAFSHAKISVSSEVIE